MKIPLRMLLMVSPISLAAIFTGPLQAQTTVNLDEVIAENPSATLESNIESAIIQAGNNGTILFSAGNYTLLGRVNVNRSVTFRGVGSVPATTRGSGTLQTIIDIRGNVNASFQIETNNIAFENLNLRGNYSSRPLRVLGDQVFTGVAITNVNFNQADVAIEADNGLGLTCTHVNFRFSFRGYATSRNNRSATAPKVIFDKCRFVSRNPADDSIRAISFDAGNDEYPTVWNLQNSEIKDSLFEDCGMGTSKCSFLTITGCEFRMKSYWDAPIHIEEFSNNLNYSGNVFNLDNVVGFPHLLIEAGALQPSFGIILKNNVVTGKGDGFYAQGLASNMDISDNDFSAFEIIDPTKRIINLYGVEGCRNITIRNNRTTSGMVVSITREAAFANTITVSQEAASIELRTVAGYQPPFPIKDGFYRIQNVASLRYLSSSAAPTTSDPFPLTAQTTTADESTLWKVTNIFPYYIIIQNFATGAYLEVESGANGPQIDRQENPGTYTRLANYGETERKPIFLPEASDTNDGSFVLLPGGNEEKTMLEGLDDASRRTEVVLAKVTRNGSELVPRQDDNRWKFIEVPATPPTVAFSNISDGSTFPYGTTLGIRVTATDAEDGVPASGVSLYINNQLVRTDIRPNSSFRWGTEAPFYLEVDSLLLGDLEDGHYELRATATDSLGLTSSATISITVLPYAYSNWVQEQFLPEELGNPAIVGEAADPFGHGLPNILKFYLGAEARSFGSSALPQIVMLEDSTIGFDYQINAKLKNINMTIVSSSDLRSWLPATPIRIETQSTTDEIIRQRAVFPRTTAPFFLRIEFE